MRKRRNIIHNTVDDYNDKDNYANLTLNHSSNQIDMTPSGLPLKLDNEKGYNSTIDVTHMKNDSIRIDNLLSKAKQSDNLLFNHSTKDTIRTYSSNPMSAALKFKQLLRNKLQYEWKNIYRLLLIVDKQGTV